MIGIAVLVVIAVVLLLVGFLGGFIIARYTPLLMQRPHHNAKPPNHYPSATELQQVTVVCTDTAAPLPIIQASDGIQRPTLSCITTRSTINNNDIPSENNNGRFPWLSNAANKPPLPFQAQRKPSWTANTVEATTPTAPRTAASQQQGLSPDVVLLRAASHVLDEVESKSALHRLMTSERGNNCGGNGSGSWSPQAKAILSPHASALLSPAILDNNKSSLPSSAHVTSIPAEVHVDEVHLLERIGGGAYGSVYKGDWRGAPVAVKCIVTNTDDQDSLGRAIREVVLSRKLTHPNVVQCFSWTVLAQPEDEHRVGKNSNSPVIIIPHDDSGEVASSKFSLNSSKELKYEFTEGENHDDVNPSFRANNLSSSTTHGGGSGAFTTRRHSSTTRRDLGTTFAALRQLERFGSSLGGAVGGMIPSSLRRNDSLAIPAWVPYPFNSNSSRGVDSSNAPRAENSDMVVRNTADAATEIETREIIIQQQGECNQEDEEEHVSSEYLQQLATQLQQQEPGSRGPSLKLGGLQDGHGGLFSTFSEPGSCAMLGRSTTSGSVSRTISTAVSIGGADHENYSTILQEIEEVQEQDVVVVVANNTTELLLLGNSVRTPLAPLQETTTPIADSNTNGGGGVSGKQLDGSTTTPRQRRTCSTTSTTSKRASISASRCSRERSRTLSVSGCSGRKRRRTSESPNASPGCSPASEAQSFESDEGFGSPVKNKGVGGVESIFVLESLSLSENQALLVVVMEHCDLGSLHRALSRKAFIPSAKWPFHRTYRALLRTAAEVAKGMQYIHEHNVVHGDLKPGNVLLKTHRADRRGYVAKVSDFGLSHLLPPNHEDIHCNNNSNIGCSNGGVGSMNNAADNNGNSGSSPCGSNNTTTEGFVQRNNNKGGMSAIATIAYTAPEVYGSNAPGKPADVFAFGIMMWEMYYCRQPYDGLFEAQVCAGVIDGSLRPEFTDECPLPYRQLAERCWSQEPKERPTFGAIWQELASIELEFRAAWHRSNSTARNTTASTVQAEAPIEGADVDE